MIDPRFDPSVIGELIELGPDTGALLVRDLIALFYTEAPLRLDAMRSAIRHGNPAGISYAAHAMRGGAGNLGAVGIAELCIELETQAKGDDLTAAPAVVDQIELELVQVGRLLERRMAELGCGN